MLRKWSVRSAVVVLVSMVLAACSTIQTPQPQQTSDQGPKFRVAIILPGAVQDANYNFLGHEGLMELKSKKNADVNFQENVAPSDAERVARGFINDGYNVLIFHGGQFVTQVQKLAADFPEVNFIAQASGPVPNMPSNVWTIGRRWFEGFYPLGVLAASSTKSGKVGVLAGIKLPDFVAAVHSIRQAVQATNSGVKVVYAFTGNQENPVAARQAATAMMSDGVDFIIVLLNSGAYGVLEAVKDKPILVTTFMTDIHEMAPKNLAGSIMTDFKVPFVEILTAIGNGQRTGYYDMRPGQGMKLSRLTNVSDDAMKKAQTAFEQVVKKEIPLKENTGSLD